MEVDQFDRGWPGVAGGAVCGSFHAVGVAAGSLDHAGVGRVPAPRVEVLLPGDTGHGPRPRARRTRSPSPPAPSGTPPGPDHQARHRSTRTPPRSPSHPGHPTRTRRCSSAATAPGTPPASTRPRLAPPPARWTVPASVDTRFSCPIPRLPPRDRDRLIDRIPWHRRRQHPQRHPVRQPATRSHPAVVRHKPRSCRLPARTPHSDTPRHKDQLRLSGIGSSGRVTGRGLVSRRLER
jgi:hypothetical protein